MNPTFCHSAFHGKIGISRRDITPPVGVYSRNWGAAEHDVADSIHRPLTLTALTLSPLSGGGNPLVLVEADLGWWRTLATFRKIQDQLLDELSLDSANFLFALSHTHSGPPLMMEGTDSLPGGDLLEEWLATLIESTVSTVQRALDDSSEAILEWSEGKCSLATTRDLPDPEPGKDRFVCGFNPGKEADDTLLVGRISGVDGTVRGTLVNYACHPTTLAWKNSAISPDYVGAMRDTIQSATGAPSLFLLGACGELSPRTQYVGDTKVADQHGRQLAYAALSTLEGMEPAGTRLSYRGTIESGAPLAVWEHEVRRELPRELKTIETVAELPLKDWPSADQLEKERVACHDRTLEERLRRKRDIRRSLGDGETFPLPIHAWKIGEAVLVGCCCEPYSILQRRLRESFPDRTVVCMNLVNGSIGYLPPAELFDAEIYQVWQTPFDRGSLEITIETMTQAIRNVLADS